MNTSKYILFIVVVFSIVSCNHTEDYCVRPESTPALKEALVVAMMDWTDNARYATIDDFESRVAQVVEGIEVVETSYIGGTEQYVNEKEGGANTCRCKAKIRFKNHDAYKEKIQGPVAKVKAEEHPLNSAYLRLEGQMNYLDNDGFVFSYVAVKAEGTPLKVIQFYPYPLQTDIDNASGLLFHYIETFKSME